MKIVAIIQARLGSTRLPGKVLLPIGPHPSLYHTIKRTQMAIPETILAIPWADRDLLMLGEECGIPVYRGSLHDVLARYMGAAEEHQADIVIRITGDCPLVDPLLITQVVEKIIEGADYASNVWPWRSYPQGLDVQAFTMELLQRAHQEAREPYDREHVCPYMQKIAQRPACMENPSGDTSHHRWTLDTPQDYLFFCALAQRLTWEPPHPTTQEVLDMLAKEPELLTMNAEVAHIYPPT